MGVPQEPRRPDRLSVSPSRWLADAEDRQAKEYEARRGGRSGVGASHTTGETGELVPEDPVEGRGGRIMARWRERWRALRSPETSSYGTVLAEL